MDLDIIASVQENIIGNCLCVLGDSMAMPVGAMVKKFRDEFEEAIDGDGVRRATGAGRVTRRDAQSAGSRSSSTASRSRPTEGEMLVDAAKGGDVEIPVFCYEPKLGEPVGACRMCLVEIEGIPKLQTACSTPVRDGMVVYTQTDRVKEAQNAVVEFLLVNHPLDCPVCDKGGECPLQDIAMGWGPGQQPLHRPEAPLPEAARALAAGRDRPRALHPLLPLRALQPGGRRGRAAPAARARRPDLRRHLRRPPLHRALPRQHHRALPGRRADLRGLPLPRPALGHRGRGLDLHALPEPVQRQVHGPRRAGPAGARPRQPRGRRRLALRQGPLRLPDDRLRGADHRAARWRGNRARAGSEALDGRRRQLGARRAARSPRSSAARPRTRRATSSSGSSARRSARRTSTRSTSSPAPACSRRSRPRSWAPRSPTSTPPTSILRARRRPAARDADPRPAAAQGGAPLGHAGWWSPPSARPRSTAAPRRPPATRPARRPRSSARWPAQLGDGARRPTGPQRSEARRSPSALAGELRPGKTLVDLGRAASGAAAARSRPSTRSSSRRGARLRRADRRRACSRSRRSRTRRGAARGRLPARRRPGLRAAPTPAAALEQIKDGLLDGELDGAHPRQRRPGPRPTRRSAAGPRRCAARAPCVAISTSTTRRPRPPTSSSRPRPTPRRRAPSPTPTAACSACARTSRARGRAPDLAGPRRARRGASATRPDIDSAAEALDALAAEVPFYAGLTPRGDRRHGRPLAGPSGDVRDGRGRAPATRRRSAPRLAATSAADPGRRRVGAAPRDLPRPLGRRGHRAQPGAAVPAPKQRLELAADGRRAPRARQRRRGRRCGRTATASRRRSRCASGCGPAPPS